MTRSPDAPALAARMFERHGSSIRRYLRRLTGAPDVADDLTQDVYLRVVRHATEYEPQEREQAWLFRIARNVFLDYRKREVRRARASAERLHAGDAAQVVRTDLALALARLDETDRQAFLLCEIGGLRYDEIASMLGLTLAGVRSRIYRTRLLLRQSLIPPAPLRAMSPETGRDHDH